MQNEQDPSFLTPKNKHQLMLLYGEQSVLGFVYKTRAGGAFTTSFGRNISNS